MTPFEEELKKALERRQPPADFTARVLERVAGQSPPKPVLQHWHVRLRPVFAIAALLLLLLTGFFYRYQHRLAQGQAAKQQLLVALRIAGTELQQTSSRIQQMNSAEVLPQ